MDTTVDLTFGYGSTSTLPRRTFIVNVTKTPVDSTSPVHVTFNVTAPDPLACEGIVRRRMWRDVDTYTTWTMTVVREVIQPRWSDDPLVVRIPEGFCPPQFIR